MDFLQLKKDSVFVPEFEAECRICGMLPTVKVLGHPVPKTDLCGPHFFNDRLMVDWDLWNDRDTAVE